MQAVKQQRRNYRKEWTNTEQEVPKGKLCYEMCLLDVGDKIITGWWSGTSWDGLKYTGQLVKRWKVLGNDGLTIG